MARKGPESVGAFSSFAFFAAAAVSAALLFSCAGAPAAKPSPESTVSRLGSGASLYALSDDAASLLPILAAAVPRLGEDRRFADLLAKTRTAALALFGSGDTRFRLAAFGDYPLFQLSFSLSFSRDWKQIGGPKPYWRSASGLSLAFETGGMLIISDGDPWAAAGEPEIPDVFHLTQAGSSLRGWIPEPSAAFSRLLGEGGSSIRLPVSSFSFSLTRSESAYDGEFIASAAGEAEARALSAILRFARILVRPDSPDARLRFAGKLLNAPSSISGPVLTYTLKALSAEELGSLLPSSGAALLYP